MRPLCSLRNLMRLGESMADLSVSRRAAAAGCGKRSCWRTPPCAVVEDLALEDPALHADRAVRRAGLGEAVLDVGAQRVQRNAALAVPLAAAHLGAAEAAGRVDADALGAELHRGLHRLLHRAAERDAALELLRDVLGDELRVGLGLADLLDVEEHLGGRSASGRPS